MNVNFQRIFHVPDHIKFVACNKEGIMCGFMNPPIRDFEYCEWIDCVTGSTGEILPYESWDVSVREVKDLCDVSRTNGGMIKKAEAKENAKEYRKRRAERLKNL